MMGTAWHHPIDADEMGEIKRRAKGLSVAEARTTAHPFDDGEIKSWCLLCGYDEDNPLHAGARREDGMP